ncbi:MAG TPA: DUF1492 domain-containing protein [Bacilli bacterium]|nr:DUF1492 domain-containing protein [Bacilli bacterium]
MTRIQLTDVAYTKEKIEEAVVKLLKEYRALDGKIQAAEAQAAGQGIDIPMEIEDEQIEQLAAIGRAYSMSPSLDSTTVTRGQAEDFFFNAQTENTQDADALDRIAGIFAGLTPLSKSGHLDPTGQRVVTLQRQMELAAEEVIRLRNNQARIETALHHLQMIAPQHEKLLRMRYIESKPIVEVCEELSISRRTQDNWRKAAIEKLAPLLGLVRGA